MTGRKVKRYHFETTCISADGDDIIEMRRSAKEVGYRTMLKHVGAEEFLAVQHQIGYDVPGRGERTGLTMKRDWAVTYYRSTYQGRPCFYFVWSHIEHIFVQAE